AHERPHELNAVATFKAGRRWSFGAAMVVASGTPYTRVERFYMLGNHVLSDYGPHNGERLPPYVRLDLSASYDFSVGRGRRSGINLSLYNVTAHDNVLFYRLKVNEVEYAYRPFAFALRLMPSVNYYFSF
ncbi:MAG: TonB-dependent receptor, partial [Prevotella sp.]|nr:TonB-dependent receptor [Prevotella sp.]